MASANMQGFCTYPSGILDISQNYFDEKKLIKKGKWNGHKQGDVLKIVINCEKWFADLYKNGKFQVRVNIEKNKKHYLILGGNDKGVFHWKLLDN